MSFPDPLVDEVISSGKKQLSEMSYFIDTIKNTLKVLRESSKAKAPSGPGYDLYLKCSLCYVGESFQNGKIELCDDDRSTARDIEQHLSSKEHHKNVNEMRKPGYITCMICDCDIELSYDNFISQNMIIPHIRELDHEAKHAKVKSNIRKYVDVEPSSYQLMPSEMGEMEHAVSSLSMKVGILKGSFSDFMKQQKAREEEERFNVGGNESQFQGPPAMETHHYHEGNFDDSYPKKRADPFNKPATKRVDHYNASSRNRNDHFNGPFMKGSGSFKNQHSKPFNSPAFNKERSSSNQFQAGYKPKRDMQHNYSAPPFNQQPQMKVSKFGPNNRPKRPHVWCNICMCPIMLEADRTKVFKVLSSHMKGVKHCFNQENSHSKSKYFFCSVCQCKILMSHDYDTSLKNLDSHLDGIVHIERFTQDEISFALE
ncbi:hypothetical protein LSTR_LSTR000059 [Laodelphax striatellus]|uniref:Uncharacterized protein n=1 Tax=Laodelphax striatellus TaxID=195883 RepID=A0A482X611_LAOST|nr:hypothetical protein LSTR_LSTR000059 [Laodelphax striatellus]